ncbi:MAG: hypothetical protein KBC43_09575 [Bacteroidales bacterium]|nr:hypothetical protein [Bacteroidales bacterium]
MSSKSVIIKICQKKIWFNETISIAVECSNLPVDEIKFSRVNDIYWLLEQVSFEKDTGLLEVKIHDYFLRDFSSFNAQNPKSLVKSIRFLNLSDTDSLKTALRYYSSGMNHLDQAMEEAFRELSDKPEPIPEKVRKKNIMFRSYQEKEKLEVTFDAWFKDAEFKLGYVAFDRNIPELKQMLRFKVDNDFLLPEFEFIKSYFVKALGTRKFDVKATIFLEHGKPVETSASSILIKKIDENLIDSIKNIRTAALFKPPFKVNVDKSLFTADEVFGEFGPGEAGNVFSQTEEEMLRQILEKYKVRNRKQLEFLAGVKQAAGSRLKFTLNPYFGFLFTVEGEKMNHFIWELLNSHATYIWSLDKGDGALARQYRRVEDAINQVRNSGRDNYKQAWRASHIDQDLVFHVIHHDDAGSAMIDGFVKWRHRLGEVMI